MHGGKTPVGRASRNFKHGRYSKFLPRDLQQRITAGLRDETLVSMRNELAVLDARAADLFAQCADGDIPAKVWQQWAGLVELRRKLADVELRRERFLSRHLTAEQAQALIGTLLVIINDEVTPDQANRISARVSHTLLQQGIADVFVASPRDTRSMIETVEAAEVAPLRLGSGRTPPRR